MKFFDDEVADRPIPEDIDYKIAKLSPFDFARSVQETKENLMVDDRTEKEYSAYMVNRALSMGRDTIIFANEMNARAHLDNKLQYDFFINIIRAKKRFNKWIKPETVDAVEVVQAYYGYSNVKAIQVLPLLSEADIETMKRKTRKGGLNG
jgi:uncharacterized protein YifN (PemK superfamily)